MRRCFDLARLGGNKTRTNPNVGAVVLHQGRIIAEAYHKSFGADHAERAAINSIPQKWSSLIQHSTLYVSLEPCCITGKTPPCTDIIIDSKIPQVIVSALDPNPEMNGRSITLLRDHGIEVDTGLLQEEGNDLIKPFRAHLERRPYIVLKIAQSADGYIGKRNKQVQLTNKFTNIKTHQWRSESDAILAGYQTVMIDDPALTTRHVPGPNPLRIIPDHDLSLPRNKQVWSDPYPTLFITRIKKEIGDKTKQVYHIDDTDNYYNQLLDYLFDLGICYLLVEGGAQTIDSWVNNGTWDEARVIRTSHTLGSGVRAPSISGRRYHREQIGSDTIDYIYRE